MPSPVSAKKSDFGKFVRKMRIQPNTLILFDKNVVTEDALNQLADIIIESKIQNVVLMTVDDVNSVASLPESEMEKHGWYRVNALLKTLKRGPSEETTTGSGDTGQPA